MARFRTQVSKGIEEETEANIQNMETINHNLNGSADESRNDELKQESFEKESSDGASVSKTQLLYSASDMELVNVAGFKVPYIVREHWKKGCREKRVKLSPMLKRILVDEFGLPPGISLEDL